MMYKYLLQFTFITFILIIGYSCNDEPSLKKISEGEIEYQVNYLDNSRNNLFIALLPSTVTTYFNENSTCTQIKDELGFFKLAFILNEDMKKNYSLLQIFDKKYVYEGEYDQLSFGYKGKDEMELVYTDKKKVIAKYNCNHAMAINGKKDTIHIYYSNDFELLHPNLNNPFNEIDGVLMEFKTNLAGINMEFIATKVKAKKIDKEVFKLPEGYKKVTNEEMNKEIIRFYDSSDK